MDRENAIGKIQKLLAIAGSTTYQHEAELAISKAQRMMLEHNIAMAEVESREIGGDEWITETADSFKRRPWELEWAAHIVREFFFCKAVITRSRYGQSELKLFGDRENVAIGKYVYVFLVRTFKELWRQHKQQTGAGQDSCRMYYAGLHRGFSDNLRAERDALKQEQASAGGALIRLTDKLDEAFKSEFGKIRTLTTSRVRGDVSTYHKGVEDGKAINMRTPIGNEDRRPARIA